MIMVVPRKRALLLVVVALSCAALVRHYQGYLAALTVSDAPPPAPRAARSAGEGSSDARTDHNAGLCDSHGAPLIADLPPPPSLHDGTIKLSPCVERPWIGWPPDGRYRGRRTSRRGAPPPPYKILLTNFGWNHPDQQVGLKGFRYLRSRELLQGIVDHPYFDPVDWDDLNNGILLADEAFGKQQASSGVMPADGSTRYYVFLDTETCEEPHYPIYDGFEVDMDTEGGTPATRLDTCYNALEWCPYIPQVLESPLFQHTKLARLVFLDCHGFGRWDRTVSINSSQFAQVSTSASTDSVDMRIDQGLPPPLLVNISLSREQVRDIETCRAETNRSYFFSFVGALNRGHVRQHLVNVHDPDNGVIAVERWDPSLSPLPYGDLLKQSVFAGAPAGDNKYSYRFTEALAAGAIPVVHSDDWLLPFRPSAINWTECLLHLPESTANDTIKILRRITPEQRCRMRRRCWEIYNAYLATPQGTIRGILESLETVEPVP
jgi:hypothetical protein